MDFQKVRESINKAIDIVYDRLSNDVLGTPNGIGWCSLGCLAFDQELCQDGSQHDDTIVIVNYKWSDPMVCKDYPTGKAGQIELYEEDFASSPDFLAGMIYANILKEEKLL